MTKGRNLTSQKCRDLSPSHHRWQGYKTPKSQDHFPSLSPNFLTFARVSVFLLFSSHKVSTSLLQLLDCLYFITNIPILYKTLQLSPQGPPSSLPYCQQGQDVFSFTCFPTPTAKEKREWQQSHRQLKIAEDSCASLRWYLPSILDLCF